MHADIYALYGRFERLPASEREVWIGGGVGISLFIAWLTDQSAGGFDKVTLFYFFTPGREFPSADPSHCPVPGGLLDCRA
jgi:predicted ferric reductase